MEDDKNGKLNCDSNGIIRMIDASEISLHSASSKISDEDATIRTGLHRFYLFVADIVFIIACFHKTQLF